MDVTAKFDPATAARIGSDFWQKWWATVADMADTSQQSATVMSVADVWAAQLGFGLRNAERWSQWGSSVPVDRVGVEAIVEPDAAASGPAPDDLTRIRGIGPAIAHCLQEHGVTTFRQIAELTAEQLAELDTVLDFRGRIARDKWIEQARELSPGVGTTYIDVQ